MVTTRIRQRSACTVIALTALGAALVSTAPAAFAADTIEVQSASADAVAVDYSCAADAGVTTIQVLVGDPNADHPSAQGTPVTPTCDGGRHQATISLSAAAGGGPLSSGQTVQVRAGLLDENQMVVKGTARVLELE
ncbi:hypothetical protein OHB26_23065 [Nocardia sp. NBC_01503]|uniref:hypothetical protein n=1 Tax=Nocardia sp. NBC_01503 TaxID=2975997 RepID=UPI002E7AF397|nr:hypothetical protein [Nocardia sp. NBC_01503]WTL29838.1 hypothetical protein OHB26_23065 [Nocardia sp. NBC_01503]